MGVDPESSLQSIWIAVPEVDAMVDPFRLGGDWSRRLGIPAHITLAGPFPLSTRLPRGRLAEIAASERGTSYRLDSIEVLGGAVCLVPTDERPLLRLREQLVAEIGGVADDLPPDLHLTISRDRSPGSVAQVREAVEPALPVDCVVGELRLSRLVLPDRVTIESL